MGEAVALQQERMKPQKPLGSILDLTMAKQKPARMITHLELPAVCTPPSAQAKLLNLQVSFALAYLFETRRSPVSPHGSAR